jgi:hypothetical protein
MKEHNNPMHIRLHPFVRDTAVSSASKSRMSISEWVRAALNAASGVRGLPKYFCVATTPANGLQNVTDGRCVRSASVVIRVSGNEKESYREATKLSYAPSVAEWASMILSIATGISDFRRQIDKVFAPGHGFNSERSKQSENGGRP